MARGVYAAHGDAQTIATAITVLEITAPSTAALIVNKAWVTQSSVATSAQLRVRLLRKSATITSTASAPSAIPYDASSASGATIKWVATAEGTDGNVIDEQGVNILNGYLWVPTTPKSVLIVPPSGIIALKFAAAPTSASYSFGMEWEELG